MECACYTRYTSVMSPEARQRRPPPGPFVLPQDRVPRRKSGVVGGADAPGAEPDNTPHWWSCRLCTHKDAPAWMVYNNSIHTGYRTNFTFRDALRSVWMLHNETANIWTHIVGLVVYGGVAEDGIHLAELEYHRLHRFWSRCIPSEHR